jgi:putative ABC transport system permease protein
MTLALGIGLTSAVVTIVYAVLLRPLPFHDPGRLLAIIAVPNETGGLHPVANASFADLQRLPGTAAGNGAAGSVRISVRPSESHRHH